MANYTTLSVSVFPGTRKINMFNVTFKMEVVQCEMKALPQLNFFLFLSQSIFFD